MISDILALCMMFYDGLYPATVTKRDLIPPATHARSSESGFAGTCRQVHWRPPFAGALLCLVEHVRQLAGCGGRTAVEKKKLTRSEGIRAGGGAASPALTSFLFGLRGHRHGVLTLAHGARNEASCCRVLPRGWPKTLRNRDARLGQLLCGIRGRSSRRRDLILHGPG